MPGTPTHPGTPRVTAGGRWRGSSFPSSAPAPAFSAHLGISEHYSHVVTWPLLPQSFSGSRLCPLFSPRELAGAAPWGLRGRTVVRALLMCSSPA